MQMKTALWAAAVAAVVWVGASVRAAVVSPLLTAFSATHAKPLGFSLNGWVEIPPGHSTQTLSALVSQTAHSLHVSGPLITSGGSTYKKISVSTTVAGFYTDVIAERLQNGSDFIVVDRTGDQGFHGLRESTQVVNQVLQPFGPVHMSITLQGSIAGSAMSVAQEQAVVNQAFTAIGAVRVNGIATPQYVSMAGDSKLIGASDNLQGHPVNIQVALNYNTYWHQEQIDVGSPLVTVTY
jgi:hypothetical protein